MNKWNMGYTSCACRDCFDTAIATGVAADGETYCWACAQAGCIADHECMRDDAYGAADEPEAPAPNCAAFVGQYDVCTTGREDEPCYDLELEEETARRYAEWAVDCGEWSSREPQRARCSRRIGVIA